MDIAIAEWMERSGVGFGTSGARGLATALTDQLCVAYVTAVLEHFHAAYAVPRAGPVAIGRDRRDSSPRIATAVAAAARALGHEPIDAGLVPTPALAGWAMQHGWPAVMVTGSHIPADRNGLKFYRPDGELAKADEAQVRARTVTLPATFDPGGRWTGPAPSPRPDDGAAAWYRARFRDAYGPDALAGLRIAAYGHCAVGRDLTAQILADLGAHVTRVGDTEQFIAIDTEAIDEATRAAALAWARDGAYDAIVSTDADGDRPLLADERGRWLRGEQLGVLAARELAADVVITPVSTSTAVERCGWFPRVVRTKIGSPYVIAAMRTQGAPAAVFGFEANGGVLLGAGMRGPAGPIAALETRDAILGMVALLAASVRRGEPVSALVAQLPDRANASALLRGVDPQVATAHLDAARLAGTDAVGDLLGPDLGPIRDVDGTDGLRTVFASGEIVHLRPSGNAPELRCYTEAADPARAQQLAERTLRRVRPWADEPPRERV
jgi:phosphomannomutase